VSQRPVPVSGELPSRRGGPIGSVSEVASNRLSLFLLEHRYEEAIAADLTRMHRALTGALRRLARAEAPLRVVSGVFVPDQSQCLYVVEAPDIDQVVEATDIAGLSNGTVRPVVRLDDMLPLP
jgi:hypothetical protein